MRIEFLPRRDVRAAADEYRFSGKVRLEVVIRELLDDALELVGREFFPEQYADGSRLRSAEGG